MRYGIVINGKQMQKRNKQFITLLSVVGLLLMQAVPVFAVCICEAPGDRPCCESMTPPDSETKSCCAAPDQASVLEATTSSDRIQIGTAPCEQRFDTKSLTALNSASVELNKLTVYPVALPSARIDLVISSRSVLETKTLRGPPKLARPFYILHSSFLI
ncbi:MAG: hypothetical protein HKN21_09865 [Candidatus Eisenbacteria bacterium]|uniref:Uncharacterized protein n=1 Tax=Eiseniibacteriota bacterium TaxID=2212470 RepID=A0A7Y2H2I6_UNCEI|nr:hypothetical protein [Candidatus Eisenbacteria bacterium]